MFPGFLQPLSATAKTRDRSMAHIQLFGGERSASDSSGVRLYHSDRLPDQLWWNPQTGANPSNGRRGRGHVRVCAKVYIQHQRVGTFDEDTLPGLQSRMDIGDAIDDERFQPRRQFL